MKASRAERDGGKNREHGVAHTHRYSGVSSLFLMLLKVSTMSRIKSGLLIFAALRKILIVLRKLVSKEKISKPDVPHKGKLILKKIESSQHIAWVLADETGVVGELN
jgi:hypothetical protein